MSSAPALRISASSFSTSLVDERDLFKVDDRAGQGRSLARVFPARTQLIHPGTDQAPVQPPTLSVGCIGITDSKHIATPFRLRRKASSATEVLRHSFSRAFVKAMAEIATGLPASGRDFGRCRKSAPADSSAHPSAPAVCVARSRHGELGKSWIFSQLELAAEMLYVPGKEQQ